ncbi:MAG: serine hydrolase domain-containing protein [Actinomycetaceae bacterium]|nr:serine hydrolase domain-containing protein [Actinomycetaceae bacterium]
MNTGFDFPHALATTNSEDIVASTGDVDDIYPLASVTKVITALAALVAVERHLVDLDAPAGPPGSTIRHLLAHASGLPFDGGARLATPGSRRVYSNRGIEVLGEHLAEASGMSVQEWIEQSVLLPLGMAATTCTGSPAHGGSGSVRDLAALGRELLHPTLISTELHAEATSPQLPGLSGILPGYGRQADNAWGLGFEIRASKTPHWTGADFPPETFGHFGQSGSFLWVDRSIDRAGAFLGQRPFGEQHKASWPALTDAMRKA